MKTRSLLYKTFTVVFVLLAPLAMTPSVRAATTLQNLQTAYNGESNARARYLAFAQQADKEGYGSVANLFRAAARAEQVHAGNHAKVIKQMRGNPEAKIDTPEVKSTRENLQAAVKGEIYERDVMYPDFLKQARAEYNGKASKTFNLAKEAEAVHARLYAEALANLDNLKGVQATGYYVCPVCGHTTTVLDFAKCPSCFTEKEKFEKVA